MDTPRKETNCAHQSCACTDARYERDGKKFCGPACADQQATGHEQQPCRCGHPLCRK